MSKHTTFSLTALIRKSADGYMAECLEIGTVGYGQTSELAMQTLQRATKIYMEEFQATPILRPHITTFDVVIRS